MLPVSGLQLLRGRLFAVFATGAMLLLLPILLAGCEQMFRPPEPISALHPETRPSTRQTEPSARQTGPTARQTRPSTQPAETQPIALELAATMPARDPFLGQGDEIEIKVYRQDDLVRQVIVPPSKIINFPLVGDIDVHNMTANDLRRAVADGLAQYVKDPQVSVRLLVARSQNFLILGEVATPGQYDLLGALNALQAVTRAGGFTADARRQVILIRPGTEKTNAYILDLGRALTDADLRANVQLASGDIIYVPLSNVANVDRFAKHLTTWLGPILGTESTIVLGQQINRDFRNSTGASTINVVTH